MKQLIKTKLFSLLAVIAVVAICQPATGYAKGGAGGGGGGGGGGGSTTPAVSQGSSEGYFAGVSSDGSSIWLAVTYYGITRYVEFMVDSNAKVSLDGSNCSIYDLVDGDYVEVRFDRVLDESTGLYYALATKLSAVSPVL